MGRHRGRYNALHNAPYELSRSWIENWRKCEACFWLTKVKGVKTPSIPGFLINSLTDQLLKHEMDKYRQEQKPHPFFESKGLSNIVPLDHPELEDWTDSLQFGASPKKWNTVHEPTNILFGGGIDDMFVNTETGEYHCVDYKSTAVSSWGFRDEITLDGEYKQGYKRQMDMYVWIGKQRGLPMSNDTFFLYVDGQNSQPTGEKLEGMYLDADGTSQLFFWTTLIPYKADDSWVEEALFGVKESLEKPKCPDHAENCEHGRYLKQTMLALDMYDEPAGSHPRKGKK